MLAIPDSCIPCEILSFLSSVPVQLSADPDLQVKSGGELLDRLVKDIGVCV